MVIGFPILFVVLFIIFSQSSVAAGQLDNGSDVNPINISVVVIDINGNAIHDALIRGTDTSGNTVCKLTDTTGRADLVIANNSTLNLTADGYRDLLSTGPIVPGIVIINLQQSEPENAIFHVVDQKQNDIPGAFVIIEDSSGNEVVKRTDAKGMAPVLVSPGQANVTIKAEKYKDFNDHELIISENTTYTYCLKNRIWLEIITSDWFLLMLPILLMFVVILIHRYSWWWVPAFGWVITLTLFLFYGLFTKSYEVYFFDPDLKVSLFVPIVAFIGAISYVTISIIDNIETKPSQEDWKRIRCAYGRRLLMAPYIAVIALFTITEAAQIKNIWLILFFAYFVGLYTKAIEGTLKAIGMKFLNEKQRTELSKREMRTSDIVRQLDVSTGIAHKLDALGISKIDDLVAIRGDRIKDIAEKAEINESYLSSLKNKAEKRIQNIETMEKEVGLGSNLIKKLVDMGIYSKDDLIRVNDKYIKKIAEKAEIDEACLKGLIEKAKKPAQDIVEEGADTGS